MFAKLCLNMSEEEIYEKYEFTNNCDRKKPIEKLYIKC